MPLPPGSRQTCPRLAGLAGEIEAIDNRKIARPVKAPVPGRQGGGRRSARAGWGRVNRGQPLCTVNADAPGALAYAFDYAEAIRDVLVIREP
jgi:thymidine phosphorylase